MCGSQISLPAKAVGTQGHSWRQWLLWPSTEDSGGGMGSCGAVWGPVDPQEAPLPPRVGSGVVCSRSGTPRAQSGRESGQVPPGARRGLAGRSPCTRHVSLSFLPPLRRVPSPCADRRGGAVLPMSHQQKARAGREVALAAGRRVSWDTGPGSRASRVAQTLRPPRRLGSQGSVVHPLLWAAQF